VEFENEGEGTAFGTYVTDALDANLDDSVLSVRDFYSVDWATNAQTPANFPYAYDPHTRTLTVFTGDAGPRKGGKFTVETRLRSDMPAGVPISNSATVFFPSDLEETRTNAIISVVPNNPQLAYTGDLTAYYNEYAVLSASLTYSGGAIAGKPVNFSMNGQVFVATTSASGAAVTYVPLDTVLPGSYTVTLAFPGDGFYYTSSTQTVTLSVEKEYARILDFSTVTYSTVSVPVAVQIAAANGASLRFQDTEPKTLRLFFADGSTRTALGSAVVSSDTAHFVFDLPHPLRVEYALEAEFDGDSKYYGTVGVSTLTVVDVSSPVITVSSPVAGASYAGAVPVRYTVTDNLDPAPTSYAYLTSLATGATVFAANNADVPAASLSNGSWTLTIAAQDFAGNISSVTTGAFDVSVFVDTTPPAVNLVFPSTSAVGVEQAFTGVVPVVANAYDANLSSWTISYAASTTAAGVLISSGSVALSSSTAVLWNTAGLSGGYNLRVEGCDTAGNCAALAAPVYIGVPALAQVMGRREKLRLNLTTPRGVAVGPDGLVWVADTGADRVIAVNTSGVVVRELGGGLVRRGGLRLNKPQSVAVDPSGNVYVADTYNHRILKLTPGGAVLLEISKTGRRPYQLFFPSSVALDAAGNIYTADKNLSRVNAFSPDGKLLLSFSTNLSAGDYQLRDGYGSSAWESALRLIFDAFMSGYSRPAGIAVSSGGDIWISDERGNRLMQFTPSGKFVKSLSGFKRPAGLRFDRADMVYLADRLGSRIQKLDRSGRAYWNITGFYMPADVALAPDGSLWAVDAFRCALLRYGLPPSTGGRARSGASAPEETVSAEQSSLLARLEPEHSLYVTDEGVKVGKVVDAAGGAVSYTGGARVILPQGALAGEAEITVMQSTQTEVQRDAYLKTRKLMPAGAPYEFGPEGMVFSSPATLTIPYDASQIPAGKTERDLAVYNWDEASQTWQPVESQLAGGALTAQTNHFSLYQPMVQGVNPMAAVTFAFRQFYVYPNPAKGGNKPILHLECGIGDGADIRIYDVSGQLRHSARMDGAPNISSPEYAYEYTWDMSGAGSGIYTAIMEAHNGGETVKAKKKFAIVR
ncbi:MAG: hypothetical protein WC421_11595, partial [Elusimicrobiales bacterium]